MVGLILLSGPLAITLFYHGQFTQQDVSMTQACMKLFSIGLPAFMCIKLFVAAFYARQDINRPVKIASLAMGVNIVVNLILIVPIAHLGLALGTAVSTIANALALGVALIKTGIYKPLPGWLKFTVQLVFANTGMAFLLWVAVPVTKVWLAWHWPTQIGQLLCWLMTGSFVYFSSLWLSGMRLKTFLEVNQLSGLKEAAIN